MNIGSVMLLKEIRKRELWPAFLQRLKYNPHHISEGEHGGEFTSDPAGGKITSIDEAIRRLGNGQGVEFERPKDVVTLIHKLRDVVREAEAAGEKPKIYDITKISVKGTNLFAEHNVNIPRNQMPALRGVPKPFAPANMYPAEKNGKVDLTQPYLGELAKQGIAVERVSIPATHVRPAQNQIDGAKVSKILHDYEKHGIPERGFVVSKEHYIVDGHHHWAAQVTLQLEQKRGTVKTQAYRVNEKILPLLKRTKEYTKRMGISGREVGKGFKYNPHHVPSGPSGGEFTSDPAGATAERNHQRELAAKQTNPLAHPQFVLGMDNAIGDEITNYVAAYGEEFTPTPLPDDIERGTMKECYRNVTLLVMEHPELTFVEGFGTTKQTGGIAFLHAWAVTKDGKVVDPTWDNPEDNTYFGVKYDRAKYLKHIYKAKFYGVMSSDFKVTQRMIDTGGKKLR
jgi:hypothetical protein